MAKVKGYSATYYSDPLNGEPGWSYEIFYKGRLVAAGWSRGRKHHAEADVREVINVREALHDAAARKVA